MIAAETSDVAAIITAIAVLVATVGGFFIQWRQIRPIHAKVTQIDNAVNGKPPGASTLVKQVQDLTDQAFPPSEISLAEPNGVALKAMVQYLVNKEKEREAKEAENRGI